MKKSGNYTRSIGRHRSQAHVKYARNSYKTCPGHNNERIIFYFLPLPSVLVFATLTNAGAGATSWGWKWAKPNRVPSTTTDITHDLSSYLCLSFFIPSISQEVQLDRIQPTHIKKYIFKTWPPTFRQYVTLFLLLLNFFYDCGQYL